MVGTDIANLINTTMGNTTSNAVAWLALIIAVVALVLGWMAFNRTGVNVEELVQQQVRDATAELETEYQQLEARVRQSTAEGLRDAAQDVQSDQATSTVGE